jgi:hypothetical protein
MIRKGYLAAAILLTLFLLITALNTACKEPSSSYDRFPAFSPYQMLSSEDIAFLEDTFSLPSFSEPTTDEEVAQFIL